MLIETKSNHFMIAGPIRTEPRYTLTPQKETPVCTFAVSAQGRDAPLCNLKGFYDLAMVMAAASKGDACFAVARKSVNESNGKIYTDYLVEFVSIASASAAAGAAAVPNAAPPANTLTDGAQDASDEPLPF